MTECIICYEPVLVCDKYTSYYCNCKYEAHIQCIQKCNMNRCILCNMREPESREREVLIVLVSFVLFVVWIITIQ